MRPQETLWALAGAATNTELLDRIDRDPLAAIDALRWASAELDRREVAGDELAKAAEYWLLHNQNRAWLQGCIKKWRALK